MDASTKAMISLLPEEAQNYTTGMYETVEDVYNVNPMNLVNKEIYFKVFRNCFGKE